MASSLISGQTHFPQGTGRSRRGAGPTETERISGKLNFEIASSVDYVGMQGVLAVVA
jgi:hypothetical protein